MHAPTARPRRSGQDRGANIVEMALLLPLLMLFLIGVADLGRAFFAYVALTNATREGARFASRYPFTASEDDVQKVIARVQDEPAVPGAAWTAITATVDGLGDAKGEPVTVTATLEFDTLIGSMIGLDPLTLRSQVTMRIFGIDGMSD